jgi:hypothetical protein
MPLAPDMEGSLLVSRDGTSLAKSVAGPEDGIFRFRYSIEYFKQ